MDHVKVVACFKACMVFRVSWEPTSCIYAFGSNSSLKGQISNLISKLGRKLSAQITETLTNGGDNYPKLESRTAF